MHTNTNYSYSSMNTSQLKERGQVFDFDAQLKNQKPDPETPVIRDLITTQFEGQYRSLKFQVGARKTAILSTESPAHGHQSFPEVPFYDSRAPARACTNGLKNGLKNGFEDCTRIWNHERFE
jgi:hypothetical protein